MAKERDAATLRAAERAGWPVRRYELGDEPDEPVSGTVEERLAMMWPLALDAWASSGKPLPSYARHESPGRVFRSWHDERPDDQ